MSEQNTLTIFTKAAQMLAECDTIQKAKELKDLAITAGEWARRRQAGQEAEQHCRSYALQAERRMGEMLDEAELRPGVKPQLIPSGHQFNQPSLKDLGITPKESAKAQQLAKIEEKEFNKLMDGNKTRAECIRNLRAIEISRQRTKIAARAEKIKPTDRWQVIQADMSTWKTEKQFDWIITDPPYPKEFLPLYETLGKQANTWLKDGGLLVAMCGQSYLEQIYAMLSKHLTYYWTAAYMLPGQPTPLRQVNVNTSWKPLLIFSKGRYTGKIFGDVFRSDANDKDFHKWGQSITGMTDIVSKLAIPGESILDPFCGAGTTGIAAIRHGCFFTGLELDETNKKISEGRISEET